MKIGVLALQGDFAEHIQTLKLLKAHAIEVRLPKDLKEIGGLIIPGGESTTISSLAKKTGLDLEIKKMHGKGMAVFGSCAGAIFVAKKILAETKVKPLRLMDFEIERNAYGRQADSFETELELDGKKFPAAFIRAPIIKTVGKSVEVLCRFEKKPVLVRQGNVLAATFHTELYGETTVHELFLEMVKK